MIVSLNRRPIYPGTRANSPRVTAPPNPRMISSHILWKPPIIPSNSTYHSSPVKLGYDIDTCRTEPTTPLQFSKAPGHKEIKDKEEPQGIYCVICNKNYRDSELEAHLELHKNPLVVP